MAQATISARIDAQDKEDFDLFCEHVGISTSAALNMYVKAVLKLHKIPFEISDEDVFYSDSNLEFLRRGMKSLDDGSGIEHDLIEAGGE